MKKALKITVILLFLLILCSCGEKKEYHTIEITGEELVNNIFSEDDKNIVYAFYNSKEKNYEKYIEDLNKVSKAAMIDIYYVDISHLDAGSSIIMLTMNSLIADSNSYYAYINKKITVASAYSDYSTMYNDLKNIGYSSNVETLSDNEKKDNLEEAKKLYDEGKIAESLNLINKSWTLKEAKEFYNNSKYYNILSSWERYEFLDKKLEKIAYINIDFLPSSSELYQITKKGKYNSDFTKPMPFEGYDNLHYYIKDDIIYTSTKENGKYKETYKIEYLSDDYMTLYEYKNQKEYDYILRS